MLRVLFYAIPLILAIYAIVDCLQTPEGEIRGLPRFGWLVLILLFPIIGSVAWLLAGRTRGGAARQRLGWSPNQSTGPVDQQQRPPRRMVAPDDDPEFLSQLGRSNKEHDALLERWEEDLRRRESDLRDDGQPGSDGPSDDGPTAGGPAPRT